MAMKRFLIISVTLIVVALGAKAQSEQHGVLELPLIFDSHQLVTPDSLSATKASQEPYTLNAGDEWLQEAKRRTELDNRRRFNAIVNHPELVHYSLSSLPEPPKEYAIKGDPTKAKLTIAPPKVSQPVEKEIATPDLKIHDWLHTLDASLQFTQAYISSNWYQGGENNMNILTNIKWDFNLNQDTHPNWLFNNSLQYKLGVSTAHGDSLRNYMINQDNFLFTSNLGYKAIKNWYYSAMLNFKTQFFNNYKSNTNTMTASFLSPAELNLGLGMTYAYKSEHGERTFNLSVAPLSYNMKICRDIVNLDPVSFGIDAGHHTKHSFGSNLEAKATVQFSRAISWSTRLYAFTNYEYVQGDWENTFTFSVTRHLNTQIFTHLRYDKSSPWNDDWRYWQFKEILSFGLTYHFSTK